MLKQGENRQGMERVIIENQQLDGERALYHLQHGDVNGCVFAGPADGESALKEARDIRVRDSRFSLRYPLWHVQGFALRHTAMDDKTRAAIWYAQDGDVADCELHGIKALRECDRVRLNNCHIVSQEFGWKCRDIALTDCFVESEYLFLDSRKVRLKNVQMKGKYSFQYIQGLDIRDCQLDTKDAFWHSRNVTVENSVIRGEYLAWYSEGLTLINCTVIGTQPLCYCKDLKLINCTMEDADLAFEYSDVEADIRGHILSVKNPRSGRIVADSVGEIIREEPVMPCTGQVILRGKTDA